MLSPATFCESRSILGRSVFPFVPWSPQRWPTRNTPSPHGPSLSQSCSLQSLRRHDLPDACVPFSWVLAFLCPDWWLAVLLPLSLEHGYMSTLGLWIHARGKFLSCRGFSEGILGTFPNIGDCPHPSPPALGSPPGFSWSRLWPHTSEAQGPIISTEIFWRYCGFGSRPLL